MKYLKWFILFLQNKYWVKPSKWCNENLSSISSKSEYELNDLDKRIGHAEKVVAKGSNSGSARTPEVNVYISSSRTGSRSSRTSREVPAMVQHFSRVSSNLYLLFKKFYTGFANFWGLWRKLSQTTEIIYWSLFFISNDCVWLFVSLETSAFCVLLGKGGSLC